MALTLLVVEDNERTRAQIEAILKHSSFQLTVAVDGLDALNQAREHVFDAVLIDHKMPLMDGFTLLKNLRENTHYAHIPLLFMTTSDPKQVADKAVRLGADVVLGKPLNSQLLLTTLRQFAHDCVVA